MSHADVVRTNLMSGSGSYPPRDSWVSKASDSDQPGWLALWSELYRTSALSTLPDASTQGTLTYGVDALPRQVGLIGTTPLMMILSIENVFGGTMRDMAAMLGVTRQTMHNYKKGMEPAPQYLRRLQCLAVIANETDPITATPTRDMLKVRQPEGYTLLDLLSADQIDPQAVRALVHRSRTTRDHLQRENLFNELARAESPSERGSVMKTRHARGKPVYVGDPQAAGKLIRIDPDGKRVRGRMVRRQFVADD